MTDGHDTGTSTKCEPSKETTRSVVGWVAAWSVVFLIALVAIVNLP